MNETVIVACIGGIANIIWMLANLAIKNQIGTKIDALKEWMDGRYVATGTFTEYRQGIAVQHVELERRITKLELSPRN